MIVKNDCETDGSSAALTSTVHIAGGGAVSAGGGCSDAARGGGDRGVAEVRPEAGRGAEEGLQRGQEAQLPDQELELSTRLREILQRPEKATRGGVAPLWQGWHG